MIRSGSIDSLQLLRGIAATLVAGFHLNAAALAREGSDPGVFALFQNGEYGVDLFFVLSGFIIYLTSAGKPGLTARGFATARFWRIFPPYWAVLALHLALVLVFWRAAGDASRIPDAQSLAVSVLLLPFHDQIIGIAWTLTLEVAFYILFALSFFRFGPRGFLLAMVGWIAATQAYRMLGGAAAFPAFTLLMHSIVAEFLFGALIARAFLSRTLPGTLPALIVGTASMAALVTGVVEPPKAIGREIHAGLPATLVVYGLLGIRRPMPRWVMLWGESSYLLYLAHLAVFGVAGRAIGKLAGVDAYASGWTMAVLLALALGVSAAATILLERPYQRWYRRRLAAGRPR